VRKDFSGVPLVKSTGLHQVTTTRQREKKCKSVLIEKFSSEGSYEQLNTFGLGREERGKGARDTSIPISGSPPSRRLLTWSRPG